MDLYFWIMIAGLFGLQLLCWGVLYLIEKYTWNNGVSRLTGGPWTHVETTHHGCVHKFASGDHRYTFHFRFDK